MTDDIVTRLRALAAQMSLYGSKRATALEAANEIQRLRAELVNVRCVVTDDIVTQLRTRECTGTHSEPDDSLGCIPCEAADEIERLRAIIKDIADAATNEGTRPGYHRQQVNYVRTMWNPLWRAIGKAVKEVDDD